MKFKNSMLMRQFIFSKRKIVSNSVYQMNMLFFYMHDVQHLFHLLVITATFSGFSTSNKIKHADKQHLSFVFYAALRVIHYACSFKIS